MTTTPALVLSYDHGASDRPLLGETIEHIIDQSLAADPHQRLGYLAIERPHARTETGGEHHRAIGWDHVSCGLAHRRVRPLALHCIQSRHMGNIPGIERFQGRVTERALQISPYPRHVTQVLRLAVAQIEAREDAENLAGALRGKRDVGLDERSGIEIGGGLPPASHVAAEEGKLELFGDVDARILKE